MPLTVSVEPLEALEVSPVELPEPRALQMQGQVLGGDERTFSCEGTVRGALSLTLLKNLGEVSIVLRVRYQACSNTLCFPPSEVAPLLSLVGLENTRD